MTMLKKMIAPSLIAMLGAAGVLMASQSAAVASPDNKSYNFTSTKSSSGGNGGQMSGSYGSMGDHDGYDDDRGDDHDGGYGDSDGHDGSDHDGGDHDGGDSDGGDSDGGDHD